MSNVCQYVLRRNYFWFIIIRRKPRTALSAHNMKNPAPLYIWKVNTLNENTNTVLTFSKQDVWKAGSWVLRSFQAVQCHLKPLFVGLSDCKLDPSPLRAHLCSFGSWIQAVTIPGRTFGRPSPPGRPMTQHTSCTSGGRTLFSVHAQSIN